MIEIRIAQDFSDTPGGRHRAEGEHSGEEFRDTILKSKLDEAIDNGKKMLIDLDGCYGFPSSFLDESFGELAKEYAKSGKDIAEYIELKSDDQPSLINDIKELMKG